MNNMIIPLFKVISSASLDRIVTLETAIDTFLTNPSQESVKPLQGYFDALYSSHAHKIQRFNEITIQLNGTVQEKSALKQERNKLIAETKAKDNLYTFHFQRIFLTALLKSEPPQYGMISQHISEDLKSIIGPYITLLGGIDISPSIPKLVSTQMTRIDAFNSSEMLKKGNVTLLSRSTPITNTENEQWVNYVNEILQKNKALSQEKKSNLLNLNIKQLHLLSKLKSLDDISLESTTLSTDLSNYFQDSPLKKLIDCYLSNDAITTDDMEILFNNKGSLEKLHEVTPQEGSVGSKLTPLLKTLKELDKLHLLDGTTIKDQLDENTYIEKIFEDITQTSSLGFIRLAVNKASEFRAIFPEKAEDIDELVSQELIKLTTQLSKLSLDTLETFSAKVSSTFNKTDFTKVFNLARIENVEFLSDINKTKNLDLKNIAIGIFLSKTSTNPDHLSITQLAKLYNENYAEPQLKDAIFKTLEGKLLAKTDPESQRKLKALLVLQYTKISATQIHYKNILNGTTHTQTGSARTWFQDDRNLNAYMICIRYMQPKKLKGVLTNKQLITEALNEEKRKIERISQKIGEGNLVRSNSNHYHQKDRYGALRKICRSTPQMILSNYLAEINALLKPTNCNVQEVKPQNGRLVSCV